MFVPHSPYSPHLAPPKLSSRESETTSLTSSIAAFRYENGRRYAANKEEYWAPNDEDQNDQLDIAHHIFLLLLDGKLHLAPIEEPQMVLDVGTGTGLWVCFFVFFFFVFLFFFSFFFFF